MRKTNQPPAKNAAAGGRDALSFFLFLILILIFWSPALLPGKALYLRDLSLEIIPYRSFWVNARGWALWVPYGFFGMPYAANPQLGAFYPLNFIFFINPIWKGLLAYIIVHYILAVFFTYLFLRETGFSLTTSIFGAVAFCFSGFFSSFSNLIVLLSAASWLGLAAWLLIRSLKYRWLPNILFLSLVFAMQILAGDPQIFLYAFLICIALGTAYAWKSGLKTRPYTRIFGGLGLALLFALILTSGQSFLTIEMLSHSNRAAGYSYYNFTLWSLVPKNLLTLFFPNNFVSPESPRWGAGFFSPLSFLLSIYPGIIVLFLAALSVRGEKRFASLFFGLFLFGIFMALGAYNPFYKLLYAFSFLRGLRLPEKYYFLSGFSLVMLACQGLESLREKPLKIRAVYWSAPFFFFGIALLVVSFLLQRGGLRAETPVSIYRLFFGSSLARSMSILFVCAGWILAASYFRKSLALGAGVIALLYLDLASAHIRLNAATDAEFYSSKPAVITELGNIRGEDPAPLRIAAVHPERSHFLRQARNIRDFYVLLRDALDQFWSVYYRLDDVLVGGSFYPADIDLFHKILEESLDMNQILARCGVKYIYEPGKPLQPLPDALGRAMIFYQAEVVPDRQEMIKQWSSPRFLFREKVLLEKSSADMPASHPRRAEPAPITSYSNQKVLVKFSSSEPGWLVLFDSYFPGWRAYLDGKETEIIRGDVFFRAVAVPAGTHTVEFVYLPRSFVYGIIIGAAGFFAWAALLIFGQVRWKKISSAGSFLSSSWY